MPGYHISPTTGKPNKCRATVRACPVGGAHYESKAEAFKGQEEKLALTHPPTQAFKKKNDGSDLSPEDESCAVKAGLKYKGKGEATVQQVTMDTRKTIAALRQLEAEMPGTVSVLNGGAYYRFKAHSSEWTMEAQSGADGVTHVRIFNAGVPVYGDHSRDRAWTFLARPSVAAHSATIGQLYKTFIAAPENQASEPMWG